jgi:hypothetical protein
MKGTSTVAAALAGIAVIIGIAELTSAVAVEQSARLGSMKGRVGTTRSGGDVLPPESAVVYILFSAEMARDAFGREWSFTHAGDLDTAGGQYTYQLNNLLDKNKDLKRLEKSVRHNPKPEDANQIATYYLQTVDDALAGVRSWLAKHPNRSWQMKTFGPDAQGFWSAEGLPPGGYEVVVRGTLSGYDADWEGSVDLRPGGTISLPLTRPRFFCRK